MGASMNVQVTEGAPKVGRALATRVLVAGAMAVTLGLPLHAQTAPKPKPATKAAAKPATSLVDTVIALVKGGLSEALVIQSIRQEGKPRPLAAADLLKLQQAGVSEQIMAALTGAGQSGSGAPASAGTAPSAAVIAAPTGPATPFPPDLPDALQGKRRLAVRPFDYAAVATWVTYWFKNDVNIGEGIRAMLTTRMHQSKNITLLERTNLKDVMAEQDFGTSNRVRKGSASRVGQLSGADVMLYGDIVIFGRDDTSKRKGVGAVIGAFSRTAGALVTMNKEEKAVVGINLRLVDTETGEVLETAEARGESSRKSKDYAGVLGIGGVGAVGAAGGMSSSNFEATIIGEATSNAVTQVVEFLESRVPKMPAKPRQVEGRVANITANGLVLTVGGQDGVLRGDRFEILRIDGEIKDPVTKEVIDLDAVKVGEFVADNVRDKSATGLYGGQPLAAAYATSGKGYAARLMVK